MSLFPFSFCVLAAAAPPEQSPPDELIRRANAAFLRGDADEADRLYAAAEEPTADPGLVAFNRAAVLFARGEYRDAAVHYARVLDDAACPPDRAARAWFNRGTCLLRRGSSSDVYRSAVACLERCLESPAADDPLKADARHNLELAKLLWKKAWDEEEKAGKKPPTPNDAPPPEEPRNDSPQAAGDRQPGTTDPGQENPGGTRPTTQQGTAPTPGGKTDPAQAVPAPGNAPHLDPLRDTDAVQPLSPEDTREYLRRAAERLKRERQNMLRTLYGPERPGVRDW